MITSHTAAISAVLFYFGWVRTHAIFDSFGIDTTLLGYSAPDYVLRSVDVAFPPLIGAGCVALMLLGVHRVVISPMLKRSKRDRIWHILRRAVRAAQACAIILVMLTVAGILFWNQLGAPLGIMLPLSLTAASILLYYTTYLKFHYPTVLGKTPTASGNAECHLQGSAFLTVGLLASLWAVVLYANQVGAQIAANWAANLRAEPAVVLYSVDRVALTGPGVETEPINQQGTKYHYQYSGLRLLVRANDKFILFPMNWQRGRDRIMFIKDDQSVRVDIIPGG